MEIQKLMEATKKKVELAEEKRAEMPRMTKNKLIEKGKFDIQQIEDRGWNIGEGYNAPHFPFFTKKIENFESGLYLFAGESNSGKTTVMTNIFWDLVLHKKNKLYGIYFSLDDAKNELYPRIIAMQKGIPIGCVKKPRIYQKQLEENPVEFLHYSDYLIKREEGFALLMEQSEHVIILDTSTHEDGASNDEEMYNMIKNIQRSVKKEDSEANIIVAIDALDDIHLKHDAKDRDDEVAKMIKQWAIQLDIPIFATKHLKKLNANRRPTLDDLRQSNTLVYEASAVFNIFNDVSKNKQQAKVFYLDENGETKQPVIEIDWAKNKKSDYKGISFAHLIPSFSKIYECTEEQGKHYERSVYSL